MKGRNLRLFRSATRVNAESILVFTATGSVAFSPSARPLRGNSLSNETCWPLSDALELHVSRMPRLFSVLVGLLILVGADSYAQLDSTGEDLVKPSLIADTNAIVPEKPFTVAVRMQIKPGWHVYWRFGGDAGAPPTVAWELPAGFKVSAPQWPLPTTHKDEGDLITYIHEGELALLYEITPPAQLPASEVTLKAALQWLVCEKICIPGKGDATLTLRAGSEPQPVNAEFFAGFRAQLPKPNPPSFRAEWDRRAEAYTVRLTGLPKEARVEFFPLPAGSGLKPERPEIASEGADGTRVIKVPISDAAGTPDTHWQGLLVAQLGDGPREGWMLSSGGESASAEIPVISGSTPAPAAMQLPPREPLDLRRLLSTLLAAFLGGIILNLMPCVLPVIGLKIYGFIEQAGHEPGRVFQLGLAFCAGVLAFFLTLAVLIVGFFLLTGKTINYGLQFQNAYILAAIVGIVFIFSLSLLGVFEINLGGDTATGLNKLSQREGYGGAFLHGLFTTLLGTACTGPLLGPVLAIAFLQPGIVTFLVLGTMGLGMALPYFVLTAKPAWMRYLPRPGLWMERLKQLMGFLMLGVMIWLLWVLGLGRDANVVVTMCAFLLVLGIASWVRGAWPRGILSWLIAVILAAAGWMFLIHGRLEARTMASGATETKDGLTWQPFSPDRVNAAIQSGQPVFIDFTADWCINCKVNENLVINTAPVHAAFKEKNFLLIKADWTNGDPVITEWLHKYGRVGVPVYVIYNGRSATPDVLPEVLTQNLVLERLRAVPGR